MLLETVERKRSIDLTVVGSWAGGGGLSLKSRGAGSVGNAGMSGRGGSAAAKRPKTNDDADDHHHFRRTIEQLTARVDELTTSNEELTVRNDELESENRGLRGEENHDDSLLPVVKIRTFTVDLSRIDPILVAHVASFLGLSRELLSMALTCKAFGWRGASSTPGGSSLVEEVARQFLANQLQPNDVERDALPRYNNGTSSWLPILNDLERLRRPLKFSKLIGPGIAYSGSDSRVKGPSDARYKYSTAMSDYVMRRGVHFATFNLINVGGISIGVARPLRDYFSVNKEERFSMFDNRRFGGLRAQQTDEWVGDVHCCQIECREGYMVWTNFQQVNTYTFWEGYEVFNLGDTVGLLVDLNRGTLTVYKDGRRLGVAKDGLAGEYCFFASLMGRDEVSIQRGTPPEVA